MANPTIDFITGKWTTAFENWFDRSVRASKESENGVYSPERFLSDTIASWKDFAGAWYTPVDILTKPQMPVVLLKFKSSDGKGAGAEPIADPATDQLEWSDLTGSAGTIPFGNVEALLSMDRRVLMVRVFGLASPTAGTYKGTVNTKGDPTNIIAGIEATIA